MKVENLKKMLLIKSASEDAAAAGDVRSARNLVLVVEDMLFEGEVSGTLASLKRRKSTSHETQTSR